MGKRHTGAECNWRLKEACEVGARRSCGVQTEAGENVLCSQWVPTNPRRAEAPRRRGLLPAGQGIADSWASVVRGNLAQRWRGQPRTGRALRRNSVQAVDGADWHLPSLRMQRIPVASRSSERPNGRGCAAEGTYVADWRLAIPRRHRIPRRQSNVPCRSSGNVIKTTNYWDVLQPRCGRRSTMGHVGKAVAFQGMEIPGRKRRIISSQVENCRGQPTEAESGCQRRPLCAPVTRTYRERRRTSRNTHLQSLASAEASRPHSKSRHHVGACRLMEDTRPLVNPIPHWHSPQGRMNERKTSSWTWSQWKSWIQSCWSRVWRKRYLQRLVTKRNTCPGAEPVDFTKTGEIASMRGWIYAIYQFSTGRVYVGQTIGTLL